MEMTERLDLEMIKRATRFLKGKVLKTPTEYSSSLGDLLEGPTFLKLEMMQITGSFKVRGAYYYLSTLDEEVKKRGVAACSAGNHGLGVAYAAKCCGIRCVVHVPKNIDQAKHDKMVKLGAEVVRSKFTGYDETLAWSQEVIQREGLHPISAFDDERIMAGNGGTLAAEILEEHPDVENLIFPVGGGGLAAGIAFYMKEVKPDVRLIGCQHKDSPALYLSLKEGRAYTELPPIETIAGGIEGGIGENSFSYLKKRIDDIILVSEEEIEEGVRWTLMNHQLLVEPSGVVPISAAITGKIGSTKGKSIVLLSGRNVSYNTLKRIIAR